MRAFLNRFPKWVVFGVVGMVGALLFSFVGELVVPPPAPKVDRPPVKQPVELVFVLDVTGSMQKEIDGVKASISDFIKESEAMGVPMRFALVTFRDLTYRQDTLLVQGFTSDPQVFAASMAGLRAGGGGENLGESSLDGLRVAAGLPFMPGARKVVVLITDETWHVPDGQVKTTADMVRTLRSASIESIHVVAAARIIRTFDFLTEAAPGKRFVLDAAGRSDSSLAVLFQGVAHEVVSPSMLGSASAEARMDFSAASYLKGVLTVGLWLFLVSLGMALSLSVAQQLILAGSLRLGGLLKAVTVGTMLCAASGVCAQTAFFGLSSAGAPLAVSRLASWLLVGAGLGFAMTFVIPNMPRAKAVLCCAAGGFLAAVGFIAVVASMHFADFGGRIAGALTLGFTVGIAVAMAEMVAREAFLVIHWAKNESSAVNLGRSPVVIGTANESTVRLPAKSGYPASVASFELKDGKATLTNHMSRTTHVLKDGNKLTLGSVVVEVRIVAAPPQTKRP
jgi:Ca-activated chloride channel family protein